MTDVPKEATMSRREFVTVAGLAAGAAILAACAPESTQTTQNPEVGNQSTGQTAAELLRVLNIPQDNIILLPELKANGGVIQKAHTPKATTLLPEGQKMIENMSFGEAQILNCDPAKIDELPDEIKNPLRDKLEKIGAGSLLAAGGVVISKVGFERMIQDSAIRATLEHWRKEKLKELKACEEGKIAGVGHREILTMVILASASAGALAAHEMGINGVTLQVVAPGPSLTGGKDAVNALFSIPPASLDTFLKTIGSSKEALKLTNLLTDQKGNYVMRFILEENGNNTSFFLTKEFLGNGGRVVKQSLEDVLRFLKTGQTQYGKPVELDVFKANYLTLLASLRIMWSRARKMLGQDFKTICSMIGREDRNRPTPTPIPMETSENQLADPHTVDGALSLLAYGWNSAGEVDDLLNFPGATVSAKDRNIVIPTNTGIVTVDLNPILSP